MAGGLEGEEKNSMSGVLDFLDKINMTGLLQVEAYIEISFRNDFLAAYGQNHIQK